MPNITLEFLEAEIARLSDQREELIGQVNACGGALQQMKKLIEILMSEEKPSTPSA